MAKIDNKKVRQIVKNKFNGKCAYCGGTLKERFTIDHIIPKRRRYKGKLEKGKDELSNYNPCCFPCNSSKSDMGLEQWRNEIKLKVKRLNRDSPTYRAVKRFGLICETNIDVKFYFEVFNG